VDPRADKKKEEGNTAKFFSAPRYVILDQFCDDTLREATTSFHTLCDSLFITIITNSLTEPEVTGMRGKELFLVV